MLKSSGENTNPDASLFHSSGEKRRTTGSGVICSWSCAHSELGGVDVDAKQLRKLIAASITAIARPASAGFI
jgi:hypothetical protein